MSVTDCSSGTANHPGTASGQHWLGIDQIDCLRDEMQEEHVRPGGDVLSLRAYVQLPQHVSDELLHVLMATVVESDARALSVGQWCGGHNPIRVDDDGLIVRLRELHECHERSILPVGRASRAAPKPATRGRASVVPHYLRLVIQDCAQE